MIFTRCKLCGNRSDCTVHDCVLALRTTRSTEKVLIINLSWWDAYKRSRRKDSSPGKRSFCKTGLLIIRKTHTWQTIRKLSKVEKGQTLSLFLKVGTVIVRFRCFRLFSFCIILMQRWPGDGFMYVCVCVQLALCDPMDCSPQGSSVLGIFQAKILE